MSDAPGQRRVYLDAVGCRLNDAEIAAMARRFSAQGDAISATARDADTIVINTCAVTNEATRKSRQMILQSARANPSARIVVTGCYAQLEPGASASLPGVAQVIGNANKDDLPNLIDGQKPLYEHEPIQRDPLPPGLLGHTRAFVKVQDGCDNRCTFCVTTIARGAGRSRPLDEIVDEINGMCDSGYMEAVLTGVHLGSYGHDFGDPRGLHRLVETVLTRTHIARLRLSSLEPWDLDPTFFDLWASPRLCPHLHLPLQSGCEATLRRMARRTTPGSFAALVEAARARISDLAITTDVIVGFPSETDAEFAESLAFVEAMNFARLHVFTYSARPGTAAARMVSHVPEAVKRQRYRQMTALSDRQWRAFQAAHVGRTADVLWESARGATPDGFLWSGLTGNYLRVSATSRETLRNTITSAHLAGVTADGLLAGTLI